MKRFAVVFAAALALQGCSLWEAHLANVERIQAEAAKRRSGPVDFVATPSCYKKQEAHTSEYLAAHPEISQMVRECILDKNPQIGWNLELVEAALGTDKRLISAIQSEGFSSYTYCFCTDPYKFYYFDNGLLSTIQYTGSKMYSGF